MKVARDVKDKKNGFYKWLGNKRKTKENVSPLLSKAGDLETQDREKAEVVSAFFARLTFKNPRT